MKFITSITAVFLYLSGLCFSAESETQKIDSRLVKTFSNLPLHFIENKGQIDKKVLFYCKGSDKSLYFTKEGLTILLKGNMKKGKTLSDVQLRFLDSNPAVIPTPQIEQKTKYSYFQGKQGDWKNKIPCYEKIVYENLWQGIDLVFSGTTNKVKYEFIVKPDADPNQIRMAYVGARQVKINQDDELEVITTTDSFKDLRPYAYQSIDGQIIEIPMAYIMDEQEIGYEYYPFSFKLGEYDKSEKLILDPEFYLFCGYIGGINDEKNGNIAVDEFGNIYIAGQTLSGEIIFEDDGRLKTKNTYWDVYVAKINASGTHLEYCIYIVGDKYDVCGSIALDTSGCAYIVGFTESSEQSGFPVVNGPDLTFNGGQTDGFIAKINAKGDELIYCGYIGGNEDDFLDEGCDIAVDLLGYAYVTGETESDETSLPVVVGPDLTHNGFDDVLVAKINPSGTAYEYCGYIGGVSNDFSTCITIDSMNNVYVGGITCSNQTSFPVKGGPDLTFNGYFDAFIAKINAMGTDLIYCGYIGGIDRDGCSDISLDQSFNVYITGYTYSDEMTFPVKVGPDLTFNSSSNHLDAFIAKVNKSGESLAYCGYIGGEEGAYSAGVVVDDSDYAYVIGFTWSDESSFPVKSGPDLTYNGKTDVFIAKVQPDGSDLVFCGYLGGNEADYGCGITIDYINNIYLYGYTDSSESTFPVLVGPGLKHNGGTRYYSDHFVAKLFNKGLYCDTYDLSRKGGEINFFLDAGEEHADRDYILLGAVNAVNPGFPLPGGHASLPFEWDAFTGSLLLLMNHPNFNNFLGNLDQEGRGWASLIVGEVRPEFVGLHFYFAYCLDDPFDFVSNPVAIKVVW